MAVSALPPAPGSAMPAEGSQGAGSEQASGCISSGETAREGGQKEAEGNSRRPVERGWLYGNVRQATTIRSSMVAEVEGGDSAGEARQIGRMAAQGGTAASAAAAAVAAAAAAAAGKRVGRWETEVVGGTRCLLCLHGSNTLDDNVDDNLRRRS